MATQKSYTDELQSRAIDWLRFPMAVAVVVLHCFGEGNLPPIPWEELYAQPFSGTSIFNWLRISISFVITHIAVPTFFLISGFLFFRNMQQWSWHSYKQKLKKRASTLLLPYLAWISLLLCFRAFLLFGDLSVFVDEIQRLGTWRVFWDCFILEQHRLNWLGISTPLPTPILIPLWFLRDLIVMSVISPIIFGFLKWTRHYGLIFLGMAYVSGIWPEIHGLHVTTAFFFSAGAYFAINGKNLLTVFSKFRTVAFVAALLLLLADTWLIGFYTPRGNTIYPLFVIAGVVSAFNIAAWAVDVKQWRMPKLLTQSSFFIYAAHYGLIMGLSGKAIDLLLPWQHPLSLCLHYLAVPLLDVAVCVGIYALLRRFAPWLLRPLTGAR